MEKEHTWTDVLRMLFDGYRQNPSSLFNIEPICTTYQLNAIAIAGSLKDHQLIKPDVYYKDDKTPFCSITIKGICLIDSAYIKEKTFVVLEELARQKKTGNIVEYLNTSRFHWQFAQDFAYYLQKLGLLTIEMIDVNLNCILCDLSEEGKDELDRNEAESQMKASSAFKLG